MPKLIFLGTGTSTGVPQIGCKCEVCRSNDTRDKRLRTSALYIGDDGSHILIDCGPDFREQMLRQPCDSIDAVLLTHEHYDHVGELMTYVPLVSNTHCPSLQINFALIICGSDYHIVLLRTNILEFLI